MKRMIIAVAALACVTLVAESALDTYALTQHDQVLAAQSTTLVQSPVTLLAPQALAEGGTATGNTNDVSAYSGKALLVCSVSTGSVSVTWGYAAATLTASTNTFTSGATMQGTEIDLDALQGTNAALYVRAFCTNTSADTTNAVSVALIPLVARATLQTITGAAVDTIGYKGYGTIMVSIGAPLNGATNFSGIVAIQRAAASTGTYATVTNLTGTVTHSGNAAAAVTRLPYEFGVGGRYIRAVYTTTNDAAAVCVTINSFK